jgi:hypothetical protein
MKRPTMQDPDFNTRLARVEAQLAIQQLPARYALAVDSRDLDALVALFADDVPCGRWGSGRQALKDYYASGNILKNFYRSIHQVCGHTIDLIDNDHARGTVYCRAEHEDGDHWVVMAICYFDTYERRNGAWYFARRDERHWYSTDWDVKPHGPDFQDWPGKYVGPKFAPRLPHTLPGWEAFWRDVDPHVVSAITHAP